MVDFVLRSELFTGQAFQVNLKKGQYIFIYFDLKKHQFSLKQQITPRGYD